MEMPLTLANDSSKSRVTLTSSTRPAAAFVAQSPNGSRSTVGQLTLTPTCSQRCQNPARLTKRASYSVLIASLRTLPRRSRFAKRSGVPEPTPQAPTCRITSQGFATERVTFRWTKRFSNRVECPRSSDLVCSDVAPLQSANCWRQNTQTGAVRCCNVGPLKSGQRKCVKQPLLTSAGRPGRSGLQPNGGKECLRFHGTH